MFRPLWLHNNLSMQISRGQDNSLKCFSNWKYVNVNGWSLHIIIALVLMQTKWKSRVVQHCFKSRLRYLQVWVQAHRGARSRASARRAVRVDAAPATRRPEPADCGVRPSVLRLNYIDMLIKEIHYCSLSHCKTSSSNLPKLSEKIVKKYLKSSIRGNF